MVVERNWCCQFGEIDIVAQIIDSTDVGQRGEVIVFEVKGRHKHSEWTESLLSNRKKKRSIYRLLSGFIDWRWVE